MKDNQRLDAEYGTTDNLRAFLIAWACLVAGVIIGSKAAKS